MIRDMLLTLLAFLAPAPLSAASWMQAGPALPRTVASDVRMTDAVRLPPVFWAERDTADVLYRRARDLMSTGRHAEAAEAFRSIVSRHPESEYAADAPYWEAFNLYRLGAEDPLRRALQALERQAEVYPDASSRRNGEARALETRIRGQLADRGDEAAARAVRETAQAQTCGDQDLETRTAALNALVQIGSGEAIPILREVLARGDACGLVLRRRVPHLLSRLGEPEATDLLLGIARSDADSETRESAIAYLGGLGSTEATDLLIEIARSNEDTEIRAGALSALGRVGGGRYDVVRVAGGGSVRVVRGVVVAPGSANVTTRLRTRSVEAASERGSVGGVAPADEDPRILQLFREVAADTSSPLELRRTAVEQLGRRDPDDLVPFLGDIFRMAPELREHIVNAVGRSGRADAMEWLLSVAADASVEEGVRQSAVHRAGLREDEAGAYLSLYPRLELASLKKSFLMGLASRDESAAVDLLIRVAREEDDPEIRQSAIYWLGRSGDARAAGVLREIIGGTGDGTGA